MAIFNSYVKLPEGICFPLFPSSFSDEGGELSFYAMFSHLKLSENIWGQHEEMPPAWDSRVSRFSRVEGNGWERMGTG